ncbi:GNAT family N-acetyltransferase [Litorimonas sp. RW-G-Af-16]|uniref:GNAT family N-acetyltransferase n=1 Tax=Litorimonas sp. RW-G-Af-16 TaxID=3241168 RepID=UPI00390C7C02
MRAPGTHTVLTAQAAGGAIVLRHPNWADYEAWADLRARNQDYLMPWEPEWTDAHLSRNLYKARLNRLKKWVAKDTAYPFHVFRAGTDVLIGACNITHIERGSAQSAKLGYWIGEGFARQGFARAAVKSTTTFCFEKLGLHRVEAAVQPDNEASIKVLEAVGFTYEGRARGYLKINGEWRDHLIYAKLSAD